MTSLNKNNRVYFSSDKRENEAFWGVYFFFCENTNTSSYKSTSANLEVPTIDGIEGHLSSFESIRHYNGRNVNE